MREQPRAATVMQTRALGPLIVPRIVLGTMVYGTHRSGAQQLATVQAAIDAGLTTIDTAPLYHFGHAEAFVGKAIAGRKVQLLGKVGIRWDDDTHGEVMLRTQVAGRRLVARKDSRPASIRRDVEESLRRLGRARLELCQVHHPDVHTPIAETMGELLRLRAEGKIGEIGVSNFSPDQLDQAQLELGDVPLACHQLEYSLLARHGRRAVDAATRRGIGTLIYSPLHRGALVGDAAKRQRLHGHDPRRRRPPFVHANAVRIDRALGTCVAPVAARTGHSIAEVVLAWLLHQPGVDALVVGISQPAQAPSLVRATSLRLEEDELKNITWTFAGLVLDPNANPRRRERAEAIARRIAGGLLRRLGLR
ncbi:MAG: aldo/keto reductase [Nannocystaceae bacterium]|nr:aldo/keto reductase [Nannocystaceae bacterium]